ncbi:MAG: hypothetical protein JWL63_3265 [Rhodocyclales bacterium]|nr:hypothetical protein [Rhodocyclales bacterium]
MNPAAGHPQRTTALVSWPNLIAAPARSPARKVPSLSVRAVAAWELVDAQASVMFALVDASAESAAGSSQVCSPRDCPLSADRRAGHRPRSRNRHPCCFCSVRSPACAPPPARLRPGPRAHWLVRRCHLACGHCLPGWLLARPRHWPHPRVSMQALTAPAAQPSQAPQSRRPTRLWPWHFSAAHRRTASFRQRRSICRPRLARQQRRYTKQISTGFVSSSCPLQQWRLDRQTYRSMMLHNHSG